VVVQHYAIAVDYQCLADVAQTKQVTAAMGAVVTAGIVGNIVWGSIIVGRQLDIIVCAQFIMYVARQCQTISKDGYNQPDF
jgi:hypothetical protein